MKRKMITSLLLIVLLALCCAVLTGCGPEPETESQESEFVIEDGVLKKYNGEATNVTVPDGVTGIDARAMRNNKKIKKLVIPDSCTAIGAEAFLMCEKLTTVILPDNGISLGTNCFYGCVSIKEINVPESAVYFPSPFSYTKNFHSIVPNPSSFTIATAPNPRYGINLNTMRRTEDGLLRLVFRQDSGSKFEAKFTKDGSVEIVSATEAGFTVALKMPDGSRIEAANSSMDLSLANQEYVFVFDFETDTLPESIIVSGKGETVVLNGTSWAEYQDWE